MTSTRDAGSQTTARAGRTTERRADTRITAERARSILDQLIIQRQQLRREGAAAALLEANRVGIVYWQQELSQAAIAAAAHHFRASDRRA
jgi:hypothetical protein